MSVWPLVRVVTTDSCTETRASMVSPVIAVPYGTNWASAAGQGGVPVGGVAATPSPSSSSSSSSCGYWAGEASSAGYPCNGEQSYAGMPTGQRSGQPRRPELAGQLGLRLTI